MPAPIKQPAAEILNLISEEGVGGLWTEDSGKLYPTTPGSTVEMGDVDAPNYQQGVRAETNSGNTTLTVYADSSNNNGSFVVYDGQASEKTRASINNDGSASFGGKLQIQDTTIESAFSYANLKTDAAGFWSPDNWYFGPDVSNPSSAVITLNATNGTATFLAGLASIDYYAAPQLSASTQAQMSSSNQYEITGIIFAGLVVRQVTSTLPRRRSSPTEVPLLLEV